MRTREEEYEICKQRGHQDTGSGYGYGGGPMNYQCRWCRTNYYFKPAELVEENPPFVKE